MKLDHLFEGVVKIDDIFANAKVQRLNQAGKQQGIEDLFHSFSLGELMRQQIVSIDPALVGVKVIDQVTKGCERVTNFRDIFRTVEMNMPKVEVPCLDPSKIKIYKGASAAYPRVPGGYFTNVELDCSNDKGLYKIPIVLKKTWVRDNNWGAIEAALEAAGESMGYYVLDTLCDYATANKKADSAYSTDMYQTLVDAAMAIRARGFEQSQLVIVLDPTAHGALLKLDVIQNVLKLGEVTRMRTGRVLSLWEDTPVFCTYAQAAADALVMAKDSGVICGLRQDLQIESFDDPMKGVEGAVLSMQFDYKYAYKEAIQLASTS